MLLRLSALAAALGVALGAFGAHGLADTLAASGHAGTWQTAVLYHLVHAVAAVALLASAHTAPPDSPARRAATLPSALFLAGILLFSGSLYGLSLGAPRFLGPITPLGGVAFIAGWISLALRPPARTS